MTTSDAHRNRAQELFQEWIDATRTQTDLAPESVLVDQPQGVVDEFLSIVEDYQALAEGRPSHTSSTLAGAPGAGRQLDEFTLIREIGRGGMGVVWEAEQQSLDRRVAIKLLHPFLGVSSSGWQRFEREAVLASRLTHSAIVQVHAVGEAQGTPYIVQELIPGGHTLADRIREENPDEALPSGHFRALAEMFATIADGVSVAHQQQIIHRDLKPSNILLDGEQAKVADFGLARATDLPGLSRTGEVLGTPAYMSPEQVDGRADVGAASDVFSLGATMYEALTLQRAFPGDTREQIAQNIRLHDPLSIQQLRSRVPRELALICLKALQKNPAHRYRTMSAFAEDLRRFVQGQSIRARPAGAVLRASRWLRRHPTASAALGVATISFIAISILAVFAKAGWDRAEAEAKLAVDRQRTAERIEGFFTRLFTRMGPSSEANLKTPGGDLLQMAEAELEAQEQLAAEGSTEDLAGEPVVRAGLWMALGSLHASLGQNERAELLLSRALDLHQKYVGPMDQRTLKAHNQLAQLLTGRAKYEEAEQHYLKSQVGHDELYGAGSSKALENQGNLAFLYWRQRRLADAEPLLRNSLRGTLQEWGDDHFHTWSARSNLAALLVANGKAEEAVPMLRAVVARRMASEGEDSPSTISAQSLLASAMKDMGNLAETEQIYRGILISCAKTFKEDHPIPASAKHNLGILLATTDRAKEGAQFLLEAWITRKAKFRAGHPDTAASLRNLRRAWEMQGLDADAEQANAER